MGSVKKGEEELQEVEGGGEEEEELKEVRNKKISILIIIVQNTEKVMSYTRVIDTGKLQLLGNEKGVFNITSLMCVGVPSPQLRRIFEG